MEVMPWRRKGRRGEEGEDEFLNGDATNIYVIALKEQYERKWF